MTVGRVIFVVPLNHIPLMVREVWSAVAVAALPVMLIPAVPAEILAGLIVIVSGTCASVTVHVTSVKAYDGLVADFAQA